MAQDISGTSLATNAAAVVRRPVAKVLFDWGDDGFDDMGAWTDETAYLVRMNGESRQTGYGQSLAGIGTGVADAVYVTLRNVEETGGNSGFRFSPSNANGSLYASIGDGKVRMQRAAVQVGFTDAIAGDELVNVLVGYVVNLAEDYANRQVTLELRDRASAAVMSRHATTLQEAVTAKAYLETLAALIDRDPPDAGDRGFDNGLALLDLAWLEDEPVWKEMGMVAEAQGGRIWYDHAGVLRFQDGTHFVRSRTNSWEDPLVSQYAFTVDDFKALNPHYNPDEVINHVIIEYRPLYVSVVQTVYTASETFIVPAGGSLTVRCEHRYPVRSIETITAETDFLAGTAGGTDITDDVTISPTTKAGYTDLEIENGNADYAAYLYKLQIRGAPVLGEQPIKYETEDATSIAQFGRQTMRIANPYVMSWRHAKALGDLLLARFKDPPLLLELAGVPGVPYLEPGDRVTASEAKTGLSSLESLIGAIGWRFDPAAGGLALSQDLQLVKAADMYPHTDYFVIGTSEFGDGGDPDDGRLFW